MLTIPAVFQQPTLSRAGDSREAVEAVLALAVIAEVSVEVVVPTTAPTPYRMASTADPRTATVVLAAEVSM